MTASMKIADPCTYRIVAKSTTLLLPTNDHVKVEVFAALDELIRTYQQLDDCLLQAAEVDSETEARVKPLLQKTISGTERLKTALVASIEIPV
jgi:hypothetical protein